MAGQAGRVGEAERVEGRGVPDVVGADGMLPPLEDVVPGKPFAEAVRLILQDESFTAKEMLVLVAQTLAAEHVRYELAKAGRATRWKGPPHEDPFQAVHGTLSNEEIVISGRATTWRDPGAQEDPLAGCSTKERKARTRAADRLRVLRWILWEAMVRAEEEAGLHDEAEKDAAGGPTFMRLVTE